MKQAQRYIYTHIHMHDDHKYFWALTIPWKCDSERVNCVVSLSSIFFGGEYALKKDLNKQYTLKIIRRGLGKGYMKRTFIQVQVHEVALALPLQSHLCSLVTLRNRQFTFSKQLNFCLKTIYLIPSYLHADCFLYLRCPSF